MSEIIDVTIAELSRRFNCISVTIAITERGLTTVVGTLGPRGMTPDERVAVVDGVLTVTIDMVFPRDLDARDRGEARVFAESAANAYASQRAVRAVERTDTGTILIVDDDEGVRTLVRVALERNGFAVLEAANGLVGQARALEFRPDLIIMDWMMPVLDGHDAVLRLKSDPFTAAIPVVMLTSRSQAGDRIAALEAGVQDFVNKPFAPATLADTVRQQLRWRSLLADDKATVVPEAPARATPTLDAASLEGFLHLAEVAEELKAYDDAAEAYLRAAEVAAHVENPDVGNKFLRLAGKMYLLLAESAVDPETIERGYTRAARAFLSAGNMTLAQSAHASAKEAVRSGP